MGFPGGPSGKEPACQCRRCKRCRFDPWVWKMPWRRAWKSTPVFLPGEPHGQRRLAAYSPWGRKELSVCTHASIHVSMYVYVLKSGSCQAPVSVEFSRQNTGVGYHFLFQGIFLTQGQNTYLFCLLNWQAGSLPLVSPGKPCMDL